MSPVLADLLNKDIRIKKSERQVLKEEYSYFKGISNLNAQINCGSATRLHVHQFGLSYQAIETPMGLPKVYFISIKKQDATVILRFREQF